MPSDEPLMPFGKHKGKPLSRVPRGYLRWLRDKCSLREPLKTDVARVLAGKSIKRQTPEQWQPGNGDVETYHTWLVDENRCQ